MSGWGGVVAKAAAAAPPRPNVYGRPTHLLSSVLKCTPCCIQSRRNAFLTASLHPFRSSVLFAGAQKHDRPA